MIYLTGDLHGTLDGRLSFFKDLTKKDVLIVLGDFGFSWNPVVEKDWSNNNFPFITISVLGNHENYERIYHDYEKVEIFGGKCFKVCNNTYYAANGSILTIEGKKFLFFGGALSIDKQYRMPYRSWWPEEQPTKADFDTAVKNLSENDNTVDYFITHACTNDEAERMFGLSKYDIIKESTATFIQELEYIMNSEGGFGHHFFGHWHKLSQTDKHTCLFEQIYDLDKNTIIFNFSKDGDI